MSGPHASDPSDHGRPAGGDDPAATEPALALGEVWDLLDSLPHVAASAALSTTTLEMAAVPPAAAARPSVFRGVWLPAALVAAAALVAGYAAGWATATDHDRRVLEHLAVAEHFDLLREAGSVGFLEELARRDRWASSGRSGRRATRRRAASACPRPPPRPATTPAISTRRSRRSRSARPKTTRPA